MAGNGPTAGQMQMPGQQPQQDPMADLLAGLGHQQAPGAQLSIPNQGQNNLPFWKQAIGSIGNSMQQSGNAMTMAAGMPQVKIPKNSYVPNNQQQKDFDAQKFARGIAKIFGLAPAGQGGQQTQQGTIQNPNASTSYSPQGPSDQGDQSS